MRKSKTIITALLCFTIAWTSVVPVQAATVAMTPAEIRAKYPDARVVRVSPEEYPALASELSRSGFRPAGEQVALDGGEWSPGRSSVEGMRPRAKDGDCTDSARQTRAGDASVHLAMDVTDGGFNGGGGPGESAVLFVVIGTVVLVVWTLYAFKFLFDLAVGNRPCGTWSDLTFSSAWAGGERDASAHLAGVRFRTGIRGGSTDVGISAEIGESQVEFPDQSLDLHGKYWLLGPLLRWRTGGGHNPHYFQMEFLAGSTENDEVGVIAEAKAGFNFGVGDHLRWGINIGALNVNLNETGGIIRDRSHYHSMVGFEMGYRF